MASTLRVQDQPLCEDLSDQPIGQARKILAYSILSWDEKPPTAQSGLATSGRRQWTRDLFNLLELQIEEIFHHYDRDGSGFLEMCEVEFLLKDLNGGRAPPADESLWLMQIADKDKNSRLSKDELLMALQCWNGYLHMPVELKDLFAEYDVNRNGYLDLKELRALLSRVAGEDVSEREAQEVMETADLLNDGRLGRYEFLGAVGSWYISVGRRPTPAMSLAFAANNRSGSRCHQLVHYLLGATLLPTVYFPAAAYFGSHGHCALDIPDMLLVDSVLWLMLAVVLLLKGHWMQLLNACVSPARAARLVYRMSWALVSIELIVCSMLVIVEAFGMLSVRQEQNTGRQERSACNEGASTPIDVPLSIQKARLETYPSFLQFSSIWHSRAEWLPEAS
mmetsp:Transcript_107651/g.299906  ORF Transcript_107651/g.299906 Transcript_107651/m.299906 type:complete len:393 (+) Transcript_107651:54-1232(+)